MKWSDLFKKKSPPPPPTPPPGDTADEDEYETFPPSPERVKARLMVLCANWLRSGWEMNVSEGLPATTDLHEWVARLAPEATDDERENHALPVGEWPERLVRECSWVQQAGGVLEWALHLRQAPGAWDERYQWADVVVHEFRAFPDPQIWRPELELRSHDELEREAMVIETCYWRVRSGHVLEESEQAYIHKLLARSASLGHVPLASDGDLRCFDGRSLAEQSPEDYLMIRSILREKLHALNWLTGQEEEYSDVTCDTIVGWLWDSAWEESE